MTSSESAEQEKAPDSPPSRSALSPCSSIVSYPDREPFETYQHRVVALCSAVFGASPTVEHLKGGDYNRVMSVALPSGDYVIRIPRPWTFPIEHAIGPVKFMERFPDIPTPAVIIWDGGKENELGDLYMIQTRLPGQRLDEAGSLIWDGNVQLEPWLCDTTQPVPLTLSNDAAESTAAMIERALRVRWDRRGRGEDWFCEILSATNQQMKQAGVWEDMADSYTLSHGDLEPRNLLVGEEGLTGVVDWDLAEFAPRFYSCVAPWWLWDWENYDWHEEPVQMEHRQAGASPPTPEGQEIKRLFDQAAGPVYQKYAYERKYQLGRALIRWMSTTVRSTEHFYCFEGFESEWASCWAELSIVAAV